MRTTRVNRVEILHALQDWCAGKYDPLIAFPEPNGFQNVIYLYDENPRYFIDNGYQLMYSIQRRVGTSVMVFAEQKDKAPRNAYTCKQWLDTMV